VLRIYGELYNGHRPHRALGLEPSDAPTGPVVISDNPRRVLRRDRLSGLLHETTDKLHERVSAPYGQSACSQLDHSSCNSAPWTADSVMLVA
jgi:hypothetical protein